MEGQKVQALVRRSAFCVASDQSQSWSYATYSTEHKSIEKLTATEPQPLYNVFLFLRTLCIVKSPVGRRVTRRLTRLKTMYNVLKYRKTW